MRAHRPRGRISRRWRAMSGFAGLKMPKKPKRGQSASASRAKILPPANAARAAGRDVNIGEQTGKRILTAFCCVLESYNLGQGSQSAQCPCNSTFQWASLNLVLLSFFCRGSGRLQRCTSSTLPQSSQIMNCEP